MQSIKNAKPDDSWQYAYFSLEDLNSIPDDYWVNFDKECGSDGVNFGFYRTEEDARNDNNVYLELPEDSREYITVAEVKERLKADPEIEIEPGPESCV